MKIKSSFFWSVGVLMVLAGFTGTAFMLLEPKAVPKIKWSVVAQEDKWAASQIHRLQTELTAAQWIVIGLPDTRAFWLEQAHTLWQGLPDIAEVFVLDDPEVTRFFEAVIAKKETVHSAPLETFSLAQDPKEQLAQWGLRPGKKLLITTIMDGASFEEAGRGGVLRALGLNSVHLLWAPIITSRSLESQALLPCDTSGKKFAVGRLGCEILNLSRLNYRKIQKSKTEELGFLMSQISERDFLGLVRLKATAP